MRSPIMTTAAYCLSLMAVVFYALNLIAYSVAIIDKPGDKARTDLRVLTGKAAAIVPVIAVSIMIWFAYRVWQVAYK